MTEFVKELPMHAGVGQRGRTLIELLVAIALGMLILLGVGGLYIASNQSTRAAVGVATSENVGNVALSLIGASIRRAGYGEIAGFLGAPGGGEARLRTLLYQGRSLAGCSNARFVSDTPSNDPFAAGNCQAAGPSNPATGVWAPDAVGLWFQADNVLGSPQQATQDCVGATPAAVAVPAVYASRAPAIVVISNTFYVQGNQLMCRGTAGTAQPLLNGVEDLKVFYGFDDDAFRDIGRDMAPVARTVRRADWINSQPDPTVASASTLSAWDYVVSVTVCVLVRTDEQGVSSDGNTVTYRGCPQTADQLLNPTSIATTTANDGRIRRAHLQTFGVRGRARPNPLPDSVLVP
jgi:type IV pilus assembly protein PilW